MVAIGGKADMLVALHMSACDPKRTYTVATPVLPFSDGNAL